MSIGHSLQVAFLRAHQSVYVGSGGRVGHRLIGVPTLILRTTGRRSGIQRASVLVYGRDGADLVVVASNDGRDEPPGWLHNVRADPEVTVQVGRRTAAGTARVIEADDPEHPRLWALLNGINHDRYDGYQRRTSRPIALVAVTPRVPLA